MEAFLLKTLRKLRKEVPRRFKDLRTLCDDLIEKEKTSNGREESAVVYFEPLKLACETQLPRLMEIGLDGIHFLIEHGYLRGSTQINESQSSSSNNNNQASTGNPESNTDGGTAVNLEEKELDQSQAPAKKSLMDTVIHTISACSDEVDEIVQLHVIKALLTAITSSHCEVHEASLLLAVRSCFHIHLITKNQINKTTAKAALTQMLSVINQRMEIYDLKMKSERSNIESTHPANVEAELSSDSNALPLDDAKNQSSFPSIYHKDAFLTFRSICKLSMKNIQDDSGNLPDPIAVQNKILSLELILHILQHCGPVFKSDEKIISVVRDCLCVALLSNCTSHITQVTGLSLQIFVALLEVFKDHLKGEMEVFVTGIFLRILESENSTYEHKLRVLEVFHSICKDPAVLVEIFINFDCDLEAIDLFQRIVDGFAKIAKNPLLSNRMGIDFISSSSKRGMSEEQHVRTMGLEGIVIVLQSLLKASGIENKVGETVESAKLKNTDVDTLQPEDESAEQLGSTPLNVVDIFDKKQKLQEEIETGILKFNLSPKKGLAYLVSRGYIEMTPKSVAAFLHNYQDRLDKSVVGDYLGREREYENGFCLSVLHEYVDAMDFSTLAFDLAIRHFLSGFRLPGEAQKIDRIMEKFAERYFLQNRDKFASADMAFILAFSTIMLQTNLHNPAIREDKRMTKEQFIRQNKGISSDGELSDEMLIEIYDRIAAEPISLANEDKLVKKQKKEETSSFIPFSSDKKRKDAYNSERKEMVRAGEALFKQKVRRESLYVRKPTQSDEMYVRPMYEVAWAPILGVLSQVLEISDDPYTTDLCLQGFRFSIKLACHLDFPVARDTYINALAKFTTLDTVREMQPKNVESVKLLLEIAISEKDFIDQSWSQILQCISQISRLQLFASGLHTDDMFFSDNASNDGSHKSRRSSVARPIDRQSSSSNSSMGVLDPFTKFFSGPTKAEVVRLVEETNADMLMREISPGIVDQIFLNSQYLSADSVLHFVKSLCQVSLLEISTTSSMNSIRAKEQSSDSATPRIFSLQKLVEVTDFNMHIRPRIAWANIWNLLANHFTLVGMHENPALAMYAIDSLKQLSIKFLQKQELSNFNFQRVFLKPFEVIIAKSKSNEIKDLILRCIDIMIRACASNIRSGWRSIFTILEVAASLDQIEISLIAFDIIERLMNDQFDLLIFDFVELMNCLVAFVAGSTTSISLRALGYLAKCADNLAAGKVTPAVDSQHSSTDSKGISWEKSKNTIGILQTCEESSVFRLWWPLLLGLSTQVSDSRVPVRVGALDALSSVLRNYAHIFSPQTRSVIFKGVLFPMIDSAKTDFTAQPTSLFPSENPPPSSNPESWIGTMGNSVLSVCLEMYDRFFDIDESMTFLSDLLAMLESCISQDTEVLAKMGLKAFHDLIIFTLAKKQSRLSENAANFVCRKTAASLLNNFCLDFAELGYLELVPQTPPNIKLNALECPLVKRRRAKEDNLSDIERKSDFRVVTNYGRGTVIDILPQDGSVPSRYCILLSWKGKLYTTEDYSSQIMSVDYEIKSKSNCEWETIRSSVMTSMVIALESIRITGEVILTHYNAWRTSHLVEFLNALETLYWHARSFNTNFPLRKALYDKRFMQFTGQSQKLPHLLEQEAYSLSKILEISYFVFSNSEESTATLILDSWIRRITILAFERYLFLEEAIYGDEEVESPYVGIDLQEQHEAYGSALLVALKGLISLPSNRFSQCKNWIIDFLSKLILCEDLDIRSRLVDIYQKHINPLILN